MHAFTFTLSDFHFQTFTFQNAKRTVDACQCGRHGPHGANAIRILETGLEPGVLF